MRVLCILLLAISQAGWAQSPAIDLRGIYVDSTAFPLSAQNTVALTAALNVPGVDGLVLVFGWDRMEPAMGQYQWNTLDSWMQAVVSAGKKAELSVRADMAPAWLFQPAPNGAGAVALNFTYAPQAGAKACNSETIAAPWDPAFLARWDALLAALSAHLKSAGTYNAITHLRLTGINRNSDELHLPAQTSQSSGSACVSDSVATWLNAGYRPSLLLEGWNGITGSFKKSFPDKYFSVAIIASANPFPPIAEDGSVIAFKNPADISPAQNLPLLTLASQKFQGRLIIQNNTLYPGVPAQAQTIQAGQSLGTLTAFQTNLDLGPVGGAACGAQGETTPCTASTFLEMLESGIYPLGKSNRLRAQYIEVFAPNVNAFPDATLQAHFELAPPLISLVANAEGEASVIAPNTWVEIKGAGLALTGDTRVWQGTDFVNNKMPAQLDNVAATVNGKPAYVSYISPSQINILTPPDPLPAGPVQIVTTIGGVQSAAFTALAQALSPSFFVFGGGPYLAATHVNGSYLGPASLYPGLTTPAKPDEIVVLYANGFGPTSTPVVSGSVTQSGTLSPLPVVKIGGVTATVQFAGLVSPGEFQFNVVVPPNTPDGDQPVTATYGGLVTQPGTLIAVQR